MRNRVKVSDLPEFDMAEQLKTQADIAEYLTQVLADGDPGELAAALGHIAKARGMSLSSLVNALLRKDIEIIEAGE